MLQVGAFLLYALITSSAAAPQVNTHQIIVIMGLTGCVNLLCEIQEYCNDTTTRPHKIKIDFLEENESENEFVTRVERQYPLNTFTILKNTNTMESCGQKALVCNAMMVLPYDQFIEVLKNPNLGIRPKLVCGDNDGPAVNVQ